MSLIRRKNDYDWMPFFRPFNSYLQTNVKEKDNKYILEITVPGFTKEDLKLSLDNGYLTIEAEKKQEVDHSNEHYVHKERSYGRFTRSYYVGDIDINSINASYINGILSVEIPKDSVIDDRKFIEIK